MTPREVDRRRSKLLDWLVSSVRDSARDRRLLLDSVLLGIVGALSSQLFMLLLRAAQHLFLHLLAGYTPPGLAQDGGALHQVIGPHGLWLIPVATTLGGLLAGLLVYSLAPEAEGHGTDTVVVALHRAAGRLRARVPFVKMIASALTIGSGGAAGREGPTALISAGVGSIYARLRHRSDDERRLLLLVGMAAGLSAIFRSPVGTAVFAVEVLYGRMEFEAGALLYTLLASVVAYVVNAMFVGWGPLFRVPDGLPPPTLEEYGWYAVLGVASGLVATLLPTAFYRMRDLFHALRIPAHLKPALGGLGVGLLALAFPQLLGGGYGWIQAAIDGRLALGILLALAFGKILALSLTVSSGGSGGVFAPSLYVGAMLGAGLAQLLHLSTASFAVVGMAAVFGGAARVPIATLLMVTEMTGGYDLLVPAALAVTLSFYLQMLLTSRLKYGSLYEGQVASWTDSPAHLEEHVRRALQALSARRLSFPAEVGHLDLVPLLEAGVPLDLPDGRQLGMAVVAADSPGAGRALRALRGATEAEALEVLGVVRAGGWLAAAPDVTLRADDQLVVLATADGWRALRARLEPPRDGPVSGMSAAHAG